MKRIAWFVAAALVLVLPLAANAQDGYVTGNVSMRAGPDIQYPVVTMLPPGTEVSVQGCTSGWEWCDVIAYDNRGWVAGNFIEYDYDNQPVLMPEYGARIGIPIVTFVIGSYWGAHYRDRPFYRDRDRWYRRPVHTRPPPPPLKRPLRPIHHAASRPPVSHRPPLTRPQPGRPAAAPRPRPNLAPHSPRPQSRIRPTSSGNPGNKPMTRPSMQGTRPAGRPAAKKPEGKKPPPKKKPHDHDDGGQ
jgi:uncharacterized protein YraI